MMITAIADFPGMLEPIECRFARKRFWCFGFVLSGCGQKFKRRIMAKGIVIIDIFIALSDATNPLRQKG